MTQTLAVLRHRAPGRANITMRFDGELTVPEIIERIDKWIEGMEEDCRNSDDVQDLDQRRPSWRFFHWKASGEIEAL